MISSTTKRPACVAPRCMHQLCRFAFVTSFILLTPLEGGLIHQWKMNETSGTALNDEIGSATGEIVVLPGGSGHDFVNGEVRIGGGDRTSADYIRMPGAVFNGLTDVSIEIWARPYAFPNWGRLFDIGPGDGQAIVSGENLMRFSFSIGENGNQQRGGIWGLTPIDTALNTVPGQLYHYVVSWSASGGANGGGLIRYYRDGSLVGTQETGSTTIASLAALENTSFWLGRSHFAADATANAAYQEVRIYDEVLSPQAVLANSIQGANQENPTGGVGLLHRWSFNGDTLDDVGGSHAVLVDPDNDPGTGGTASLTSHPDQVTLTGGARNTSAYVSLGSGLLGGRTTPITIELWGTRRGNPNWGRIFDFGSNADEYLFMSWTRTTQTGEDRVGIKDGGGEAGVSDTNAPYVENTEYHIVLTMEPGAGANGTNRLSWYSAPSNSGDAAVVRGTFDTNYSIEDLVDVNNWLGRSQWDGDATAAASYNEVRIYERVLTAPEVFLNRMNGPDILTVEAPVAMDDMVNLHSGSSAGIAVLSNDSGIGLHPGSLEIITPPTGGTAQTRPDGTILYTHGGSALMDSFTYTVSDVFGNSSDPATVNITAGVGQRIDAVGLNVPDSPPPVTLQTEDAFPGLTFEDALCIRSAPGETQRIFVGERRGRITYVPDLTAAAPQRVVMLDMTSLVSFDNTNEGELGLLAFDFHPDFAQNGHVFVFYMAPGSPFFARVSRFTVNKDGNDMPILDNPTIQLSSEVVLINQIDEVFNHSGGDIHFGPDGYLYISMGDEGDQMNRRLNAQRIDKDLFAAVLRIDVDRDAENLEPNSHPAIPTVGGIANFKIPADNPYVHETLGGPWDGWFNGTQFTNLANIRTEFWAIGMRSPWRMSFDPETGKLWLADVGQDTYEEINIVEAGGNYGWAYREGFHQTPGTPSTYIDVPPAAFTYDDPVWEYEHPGAGKDPNFTGQSVTGGVFYHGGKIPTLTGTYVFSDFRSGNIWSLRQTDGDVDVIRIAGDAGIAAFGIDPSNGDVLLADYSENKIKRLVQKDITGSTFPATLSATGIFADTAQLLPNPGVIRYEPNVAFWSDNAIKTRWFAMTDSASSMVYSQDTPWTFPEGMLWVKHFDLESETGNPSTSKRIETRLLVRNESGSYGVSYKWNEAQTEAFLVPENGELFSLPVLTDEGMVSQTYEIPSRAACMLCHTAVAGHALGFDSRQLHGHAELLGVQGNQIQTLRQAGYLDGPAPHYQEFAPHAPAADESSSLEFRVRSYLATNCAQCHQPGGAAPSTWDARAHIPLEETLLINGIGERPGTDPLNRLIVPGDPEHSILLQRVKGGNGFTRMPAIGTHVLDDAAIEMLTRWITEELPSRPLYAQWRSQHFGEANPDGARDADPDRDGLSNYQEFLLGSPPLSGTAAWQASVSADGEGHSLRFLRKANRGFLVETTDQLDSWELWDHPSNSLKYSGSDQWIEIPLDPAGDPRRFFRFRVTEP